MHSVSVSFCEARLFDSVDFVVMILMLWPLKSVLPLFQDSSSTAYYLTLGLCIYFYHLLDEASLMTIGLGTNL